MRPYASRRGSPSRGPLPVRKKGGSSKVSVELTATRGVLLPDVVFRRYCPVVFSARIVSCAFVVASFSRVIVTWAKNAAFFQKSTRKRLASDVFTCSRWPRPLWPETQSSGRGGERCPALV